jgi:DNA-binding NtrC family response regulator
MHSSMGSPLLIGDSAVMDTLRVEIARAGRSEAKVLILGETGVGKEVVARLVHNGSARRSRPFVAVNCGGIPETLLASELFGHTRGSFTGAYRDSVGLVRQAEQGTLFLDELGEMSLSMQAMLLRFAETGEVQPVGSDRVVGRTNVRLITATNRDLRARIGEGVFREDLYYRLNVVQIHVPPLRARGRDILLLLRHYLTQASEVHRLRLPDLSESAEQVVLAYPWPGNVRELKNVAERLVLREARQPITADELPSEFRDAPAGPRPSLASRPVAPQRVAPAPPQTTPVAEEMWARIEQGEDFWSVVHEAFRLRELTRGDLAALVDRGLRETLCWRSSICRRVITSGSTPISTSGNVTCPCFPIEWRCRGATVRAFTPRRRVREGNKKGASFHPLPHFERFDRLERFRSETARRAASAGRRALPAAGRDADRRSRSAT